MISLTFVLSVIKSKNNMNDRFKFRAWDGEKWRCDFIIFDGELYQALEDTPDTNDLMASEEPVPWKLVMPTSLKDKNGTLIYEGDILKSLCKEPVYGVGEKTDELVHEVAYEASLGGYVPFVEGFAPSVYCELEIIGNIHQNPKLMDGGMNG